MHPIRVVMLVSGVALSCAAASAGALTCYIVLDRNDNVVYRDTSSPVDLSDRGAAERAGLRVRGDFLLVIEADQCLRFIATTGKAGSGGATVEEIVAELRGYPGVGPGLMSTSRQGSGSAGASSGAPRSASAARTGY